MNLKKSYLVWPSEPAEGITRMENGRYGKVWEFETEPEPFSIILTIEQRSMFSWKYDGMIMYSGLGEIVAEVQSEDVYGSDVEAIEEGKTAVEQALADWLEEQFNAAFVPAGYTVNWQSLIDLKRLIDMDDHTWKFNWSGIVEEPPEDPTIRVYVAECDPLKTKIIARRAFNAETGRNEWSINVQVSFGDDYREVTFRGFKDFNTGLEHGQFWATGVARLHVKELARQVLGTEGD